MLSSSAVAAVLAFQWTDAGMAALVTRYAPAGSAVVILSSIDRWIIDPGPPPFDGGRVVFNRGGRYRFEPWGTA